MSSISMDDLVIEALKAFSDFFNKDNFSKIKVLTTQVFTKKDESHKNVKGTIILMPLDNLNISISQIMTRNKKKKKG
jgi:hypothetical protein